MTAKKRISNKNKEIADRNDWSAVDTVAARIGHFIRESITEFDRSEQRSSPSDEESFRYTLRDIAVRALLIVEDGDDAHQYFVESLLAAGNDLEGCKRAMNSLDVANVQHWFKLPTP